MSRLKGSLTSLPNIDPHQLRGLLLLFFNMLE
jgi:hypothetical protein